MDNETLMEFGYKVETRNNIKHCHFNLSVEEKESMVSQIYFPLKIISLKKNEFNVFAIWEGWGGRG
jgi:hypothetical protein